MLHNLSIFGLDKIPDLYIIGTMLIQSTFSQPPASGQRASMGKTFSIPSWNVDKLNSEINRLNKRAAKIGTDPISIVTHEIKRITDPTYDRDSSPFIKAPMISIHVIEIVGSAPKIDGYTFIGTLDHHTVPGNVIVKSVPGASMPSHYHHADATCNHCNVNRYRLDTFVLRADSGETIQVGRQCLVDFLGHDADAIAGQLTAINKLIGNLGDPDSDYHGGGPLEMDFDAINVLTNTIAIINTFGWTSKAQASANDSARATADDVAFLMVPSLDPKVTRAQSDFNARLKRDIDADTKLAQDAIAWVKEQSASNDYIHNLQVLAQAELIPVRMFGFWCSLASSYIRHLDKQKAAENAVPSSHVGVIKKRQEFIVNVNRVKAIDGYYGQTDIWNMTDDSGNIIVWFASADTKLKVGGKFKVIATVKKHDEFNGVKQTNVNRLKVLEVL